MRALERTCAAAFAAGLLALAAPAHAAFGTAYTGPVCRDLGDVASAFTFQSVFVGQPACQTLCTQATSLCRKYVMDAASCQLAFANDWISFDRQVDCAGLTGSDLADCKGGWALDQQAWRSSILSDRSNALGTCATLGFLCNKNCTGAP